MYTMAVAVPLAVPELSVTGEPLVTEQLGAYDPPVGDVSAQVSVMVPEYNVPELTVMVEVVEAPGAMDDGDVADRLKVAEEELPVTVTDVELFVVAA